MKKKLIVCALVVITMIVGGTLWLSATPVLFRAAPAGPAIQNGLPNLADYTNSKPPQMIYTVSATPSSVTRAVSTNVLVVADVGDGNIGNGPTLIPDSVNLLRYDSAGVLLNSYGRMYDDGSHGDLRANDLKFTLQVTVLDNQTKLAYFQVSVAYKALLRRVTSKPFPLQILAAAPDPSQVLSLIATALDNNNVVSATSYVYGDKLVARVSALTGTQRSDLANMFRSAQLITNDGKLATYSASGAAIVLGRGEDGSWVLIRW